MQPLCYDVKSESILVGFSSQKSIVHGLEQTKMLEPNQELHQVRNLEVKSFSLKSLIQVT